VNKQFFQSQARLKVLASYFLFFSMIDTECLDVGQWLILFFGAPKSLQMVTAAMKLKDAYSLEG